MGTPSDPHGRRPGVNGMQDLVTAVQSGDELEAAARARQAIHAGVAATDLIAAMTSGMR